MKKKVITFLLIISLITLSMIAPKIINKPYAANIEGDTNIEGQINDNVHDYFTTKITDINKLINDEITGYVYIGRDTCPICLYFNKFLEKEYMENENLLIYKFDTDFWRNDNNFNKVLDKYHISTIPSLIRINKDKTYEIKEFESENEEELQLELNNFLYD